MSTPIRSNRSIDAGMILVGSCTVLIVLFAFWVFFSSTALTTTQSIGDYTKQIAAITASFHTPSAQNTSPEYISNGANIDGQITAFRNSLSQLKTTVQQLQHQTTSREWVCNNTAEKIEPLTMAALALDQNSRATLDGLSTRVSGRLTSEKLDDSTPWPGTKAILRAQLIRQVHDINVISTDRELQVGQLQQIVGNIPLLRRECN